MIVPRLFHGGAPGLKEILPPNITGAPTTANYGAAGVCRTDRVYLTTDERMARFCAAMHPSRAGTVYEVTVDDYTALVPDPDCEAPGVSWEATQAAVIRATPLSGSAINRIRRSAMKGRGR